MPLAPSCSSSAVPGDPNPGTSLGCIAWSPWLVLQLLAMPQLLACGQAELFPELPAALPGCPWIFMSLTLPSGSTQVMRGGLGQPHIPPRTSHSRKMGQATSDRDGEGPELPFLSLSPCKGATAWRHVRGSCLWRDSTCLPEIEGPGEQARIEI